MASLASSPDDMPPEEPPGPPLLDELPPLEEPPAPEEPLPEEPPLADPPDEGPPLLDALAPEEPLPLDMPLLDMPLEEAPLDTPPPAEPLLEVLPPLDTPLLEPLDTCASAPPLSTPSDSAVDDPPHPVIASARLAANQANQGRRCLLQAFPFQPLLRPDIVFPPGSEP